MNLYENYLELGLNSFLNYALVFLFQVIVGVLLNAFKCAQTNLTRLSLMVLEIAIDFKNYLRF